MAEHKFSSPSLYVEHEPDPGPAVTHPRPDTVEQGAGDIVVGVKVNGVKIPVARVKAGGVMDDIARAKKGGKGDDESDG